MNIDLIIVLIVIIGLIIYITSVTKKAYYRHLSLKQDEIIRDTKYSEEDIVTHLDYIINEALNEYRILTLEPKNLYYINSTVENEIVQYLQDTVPDRLSKTLMTQISMMYNSDYIGKFIGNHIYLIVVDFVINYNLENNKGQQKNNSNNNDTNNYTEA